MDRWEGTLNEKKNLHRNVLQWFPYYVRWSVAVTLNYWPCRWWLYSWLVIWLRISFWLYHWWSPCNCGVVSFAVGEWSDFRLRSGCPLIWCCRLSSLWVVWFQIEVWTSSDLLLSALQKVSDVITYTDFDLHHDIFPSLNVIASECHHLIQLNDYNHHSKCNIVFIDSMSVFILYFVPLSHHACLGCKSTFIPYGLTLPHSVVSVTR